MTIFLLVIFVPILTYYITTNKLDFEPKGYRSTNSVITETFLINLLVMLIVGLSRKFEYSWMVYLFAIFLLWSCLDSCIELKGKGLKTALEEAGFVRRLTIGALVLNIILYVHMLFN